MADIAPTTINRTLLRKPNSRYRSREYLTEAEVERLIEAARKRGRNGARDACAILFAFGHGLRAQELCSLRWSQIDLKHGRLHVNRAKGGMESVHPLHGPELRALRPLQGSSPYVFLTEAGTPVTPAWFLRMIQRTGIAAKLPFQVHPHMLRHSTGYKLANDGQDTRSLAPGEAVGPKGESRAPGITRDLLEVSLELSPSSDVQGNAVRPTAQHFGVAQFKGNYIKTLLFQKLDEGRLISIDHDQIRANAECIHVDPVAPNAFG